MTLQSYKGTPAKQAMSNETSVYSLPDNTTISTLKLRITPKVEDYGRLVSCNATQFDRNFKPLFITNVANPIILNVTFPPQRESEKSYMVDGNNVTISFIFTANPNPYAIKWFLLNKDSYNATDNEDIDHNWKLRKGGDIIPEVNINKVIWPLNDTWTLSKLNEDYTDNKFVVKRLQKINDLIYSAELVIKNVELRDSENIYGLTVINNIGQQNYFGKLKFRNASHRAHPFLSYIFKGIIIPMIIFVGLALFVLIIRRKRNIARPQNGETKQALLDPEEK